METSLSRRSFHKFSAALTTISLLPFANTVSSQTRGINGQKAPELMVEDWIDGNGKEQGPFRINDHQGKWIYLKCFQEWCPACHSVGFPNLQKLVKAFPNDDVIVSAVIQTTFEGFHTNTRSALRKNQLRYGLNLPFGHDPGNIDLPREHRQRYPSTMANYRTGGTPWVIIINPEGDVVFNDFHVNIDALIDFLKKQAA